MHLLSRWQKVVNVMKRRSCLEMEVQATQAAAATAPTSPLDGFEATTRVTRNDQACRIPIVYRYLCLSSQHCILQTGVWVNCVHITDAALLLWSSW